MAQSKITTKSAPTKAPSPSAAPAAGGARVGATSGSQPGSRKGSRRPSKEIPLPQAQEEPAPPELSEKDRELLKVVTDAVSDLIEEGKNVEYELQARTPSCISPSQAHTHTPATQQTQHPPNAHGEI